MRHRLAVLMTVVVASLALAGSAVAFDCIRVSSSLQGLKQSTKSGNWLLFDFSSAASVQETFANIEEELTDEEAGCFAERYSESGEPLYFALGIGVAGPNGVLGRRNANPSMGDGKGVDHLEATGIFAVFEQGEEECAGLGRHSLDPPVSRVALWGAKTPLTSRDHPDLQVELSAEAPRG